MHVPCCLPVATRTQGLLAIISLLHLPPCPRRRSAILLPYVLAGEGGGGGGDEEFIDDDIAIEGGAAQLAPNPRCPITAKAVRRRLVAVHHCCPPSVSLFPQCCRCAVMCVFYAVAHARPESDGACIVCVISLCL